MRCKFTERWIKQRRADLLLYVSEAEKAAFRNLCTLGYKVVRQYPISTGRKIYFADLYLPELHSVVEIDGGYHQNVTQRRFDRNRSAGIWRMGYHVLRLSNREAYELEKVRSKVNIVRKSV